MTLTILLVVCGLLLVSERADRVQSARVRAVSEAGEVTGSAAFPFRGASSAGTPVSLTVGTESELVRVKAKLRYMRHLAYVRGKRVKQLKRVLMARPSVTEAINLAATVYGNGPTLWRKARCESGLNPSARNGSEASGLFQFLPSTWRTTPFGSFSIFSPYASALAAGWMHQAGRGGEWVCR